MKIPIKSTVVDNEWIEEKMLYNLQELNNPNKIFSHSSEETRASESREITRCKNQRGPPAPVYSFKKRLIFHFQKKNSFTELILHNFLQNFINIHVDLTFLRMDDQLIDAVNKFPYNFVCYYHSHVCC